MEALKEKLINERMEDEIEENEPQKDDTKNSNVKNYKSKRTTNGKKLKEGGKGDDSGDNSSSDEDDDDSGSKGTPLNNGKGKDKTNSDKGKKKEKNDEDRERNGKKDTPGEKNKDNTGRRDDSDGDGEKDDSGDEENTKRPKAKDNKSEVDDTILTNMQNQIDNLSMDLNDIKDRIEKELELDINKSKDSNQKYKEREHMIASVDIQYNKLNSELRNLISKYKDKSLRDLLSQSNDINTTIRKTKNLLKNLREKAETDMNYKDISYQELKDSDISKLVVPEFTSDKNIVTFINSVKKTMKEKLLDVHVLKTILKTKVSERVYGKLTTEVFTRQNYDLTDILKFFIKTYASPRELEENLMKFHQKTGTLKYCFKNDDHKNLDMGKSIIVIQLIELHTIGLNSILTAKKLYEEYVGNSTLAFQNNLLNYNYVTKIADKVLPNSLCYELADDVNGDHEKQISWIIEQLEGIKSRAEKARLIGFDKKESQQDMLRTTLNFIEKVEQSDYNNQQQKEKQYNNNQQQKERFNDRQNYTYYNSNNSNQYYSGRNTYVTRITNRVQEFNKWMCKIYNDMKKHDCGQRCNREEVKALNTGKRSWNVNWNPKYNGERLFDKDIYKKLCSSQRRRIALVLNRGCDYCVSKLLNNKSNGYDSLPLPHLLIDTTKMGFRYF